MGYGIGSLVKSLHTGIVEAALNRFTRMAGSSFLTVQSRALGLGDSVAAEGRFRMI